MVKSASKILLLLLGSAFAAPIIDEHQSSRFTFYDLNTPASGPCDLEVGHDGALWGEAILKNNIFRIDPNTGHVDEYPIPFTTPLSNTTIPRLPGALAPFSDALEQRTALSCAIRKGADGNLYASNGLRNQLVRINETTKEIKVFQPPVDRIGDLQPFNDLYSASNGIYFTQTTGDRFTFFDFATERFTNHDIPTPLSLPLGLFVDSLGLVYVAETLGNAILVFDPTTNDINEYALPEPLQLPTVIRAERDGWVYFALFTGNGIGRINQKSHEIEIYHTNQTGGIGAEDTIDKYGGVWYSFFDVDMLARLDTNTFEFSCVAFPDTFAGASAGLLNGVAGDVPPYVDVAVNYGPGDNIWFASITENKVGRYDLTGLYS